MKRRSSITLLRSTQTAGLHWKRSNLKQAKTDGTQFIRRLPWIATPCMMSRSFTTF